MAERYDSEIDLIEGRLRGCEERLAALEPLTGRLTTQGPDESETESMISELRREVARLRERRAQLIALA